MTTMTDEQRAAFTEAAQWNAEHYTREATRYGRRRAERHAIPPVPLHPGEQVRFADDRCWWDVRAVSVSGDHVVLTRAQSFGRAGLLYTVVCWSQGRRGPHGSWGSWPVETDEQCAAIAEAMDRGLAGDLGGGIEMSERRSIRTAIVLARPAFLLPTRYHSDSIHT